MKLSPVIIGLILLTVISLTACNTDAPVQPEPAPAVAADTGPVTPTEPVPEPVIPTDTPTPSPSPTVAPLPPTTTPDAPTAAPSPSPSPVPEPVVRVDDTLASSVNVRGGPGTNYPVLTQFEPGQIALVLGQNENRDWWQVELPAAPEDVGWIFGELTQLSGDSAAIDVVQAPPPPPTATPAPVAESEPEPAAADSPPPPASADELAETLRCGKDFCITYQAMVPIWENGGCIGNHSIYVTVLEGPPPGRPLDGIVIGDTFNNVEVASGDKGPGTAEVTLWMNSMTLKAKRHIDGTPFTSEESFNFTSHDELIPADLLAAMGYCDGRVETCEWAQQNNQVCRGHYSWRVTFHKFD